MKMMFDILSMFGIFIMFFFIASIDYRIALEKISMVDIIYKYWWSFPIFVLGSPIIWHGYRTLYSFVGNVWITHIINASMSYVAFLLAIYFVSGTFPTKHQLLALLLNLIAIFVSLT